MAYGQTGSGKTYTMCGEDTAKGQGIVSSQTSCQSVHEIAAAFQASPSLTLTHGPFVLLAMLRF